MTKKDPSGEKNAYLKGSKRGFSLRDEGEGTISKWLMRWRRKGINGFKNKCM